MVVSIGLGPLDYQFPARSGSEPQVRTDRGADITEEEGKEVVILEQGNENGGQKGEGDVKQHGGWRSAGKQNIGGMKLSSKRSWPDQLGKLAGGTWAGGRWQFAAFASSVIVPADPIDSFLQPFPSLSATRDLQTSNACMESIAPRLWSISVS
jgi:hypothetical protein